MGLYSTHDTNGAGALLWRDDMTTNTRRQYIVMEDTWADIPHIAPYIALTGTVMVEYQHKSDIKLSLEQANAIARRQYEQIDIEDDVLNALSAYVLGQDREVDKWLDLIVAMTRYPRAS